MLCDIAAVPMYGLHRLSPWKMQTRLIRQHVKTQIWKLPIMNLKPGAWLSTRRCWRKWVPKISKDKMWYLVNWYVCFVVSSRKDISSHLQFLWYCVHRWSFAFLMTIYIFLCTELIQTEKHHCRTLKIMQKIFREPMRRELNCSLEVIDKIFPNLDELLVLHTGNVVRLKIVTM